MSRQRRTLGRRGVAAAIASAVALALMIPGCGVIVEVPPYVRGTNVRPDGTCAEGFGDCNGDSDDGCETPLGTDEACTACGDRCVNGSCVERDGTRACSCAPGFAACGAPGEGCIADLANDPHHCGACGRDCSPGLCAKGICQPGLVVRGVLPYGVVPAPFVVEGGFVYLPGVESMVRARADTTTNLEHAELVFATSRMIEALAYDGTHFAWIERWPGSNVLASVVAGTLDGATRVYLANGEHIQRVAVVDATPIALDGTYAYWVDTDSTGEDPAPITLRRAPLDGSNGATDIYTSEGAFGSIAVGSTHVYWTDSGDLLHAHPRDDITQHVDIPVGKALTFVSAVGARVCTTSFDFTMGKQLSFFCGHDADPSSFQEVGHPASGQVGSLLFDDRTLYYTDVIGAQLVGIDEKQNQARTVAPTVGWGGGLVLHDDDIYWRAYNGVWRLRHARDGK